MTGNKDDDAKVRMYFALESTNDRVICTFMHCCWRVEKHEFRFSRALLHKRLFYRLYFCRSTVTLNRMPMCAGRFNKIRTALVELSSCLLALPATISPPPNLLVPFLVSYTQTPTQICLYFMEFMNFGLVLFFE